MNGCDQSHFVPANVEDGQLSDLIGGRKMHLQICERAKVVPLYDPIPMC
jgi:hypothetical protein